MSDTNRTPTVGATTLAGVASRLGLALAGLSGGVGLAGVAPTAASVSPVISVVGAGQRISARSLLAGAVFTLPAWGRGQLMLLFSGTWTAAAAALLQGSSDGGLTWANLAAVLDPVAPGAGFGAPGVRVNAPGNGVIRLSQLDDGPRYNALQVVIANGDGSTALSLDGFLNPLGAV